MKKMFYLSGIARSGSTLLGSILNQNPEIHVTPTSPLLDYLCMNESTLSTLNKQYTFDSNPIIRNMSSIIHDQFYFNIDKPIIIDKHRGWPRNINIVRDIIGSEPKVICTYRPIVENICSFIKLADNDPNNFIDSDLRKLKKDITNKNRAMHIWEKYSSEPFESMVHGLKNNRNNILVVHYADIVIDTQIVLNKIYEFLGIENYKHTLNNITNTCAENDTVWGVKGLHDIRPELKVTSYKPEDVLDPMTIKYFELVDKQVTDLL